MPTNLIYDISVEQDLQECGKFIRAPEEVFQEVAGILLKMSTEKPDASGMKDLKGPLIVDHVTQASLFSFALQCFGDIFCGLTEDDMPVYHRTKPTDSCVLQELQGDTWVDIFDFGACLGKAVDKISTDQLEIDAYKDAPRMASDIWGYFDERYSGSGFSYDPSLGYTSYNRAGHEAASCRAIREIVKRYANESAKLKQTEIDNLGRASLAIAVGLGLVALVGAIAAIPTFGASIAPTVAAVTALAGAGNLALGGAVAGFTGVGLQVWAERIKDTDLAILKNENTMHEVACAIYEHIKAYTDVWNDTNDGILRDPVDMTDKSDDAQALYSAIFPLLEQPLAYAVYLRLMQQEIATGDLIPSTANDCDCNKVVELTYIYGNAVDLPSMYLIYEGLTDGFDTYTIKARGTGNYSVFAATSNIPFAIVESEIVGGTWTDTFIKIGGALFAPGSTNPEVSGTLVEITGNATAQARIVIMPT